MIYRRIALNRLAFWLGTATVWFWAGYIVGKFVK